MKMRTFTAIDMPSAMQMVRQELGDEAIILDTKEAINGKRSIRVVAAIDTRDEEAPPIIQAPQKPSADAEDLRFAVQTILRFHNIPELFIAKMLQKSSEHELQAITSLHRIGNDRNIQHLHKLALEKLVHAFYNFKPLPLNSSPSRLMLVGMPGIGKTLTVAKMATRLSMDGQPVAVITTDNKRAGGIEQLQAFTNILNIDLKVAASPQELRTIVKTLPAYGRVLIDTAGCNPYDRAELEELRAYASIEGIEPVLVMPAGGDAQEAIDMGEAFASLPVQRLLITQADTARRFGSVLAVAASQQLAFCNISNSSSITDRLQPADAVSLVNMLLRYQLQS